MEYWRIPLDIQKIEIPHGDLHIIVERCKGCGFCVEYCPKKVLELSTDFNLKGYHYPIIRKQDACVNCNLCETICPEFAIFCLSGEPQHPDPSEVIQDRRQS